jgi:hypothetical protein
MVRKLPIDGVWLGGSAKAFSSALDQLDRQNIQNATNAPAARRPPA